VACPNIRLNQSKDFLSSPRPSVFGLSSSDLWHAVAKQDGSVFAHVHPTGSVPMASVAVASPAAMMAMHETKPGPVVSFPYGVPTPGKYRIFVQMKRAGKIETGGFEFTASEAATGAK
jgi:hypothetical protein